MTGVEPDATADMSPEELARWRTIAAVLMAV
jgi:hypothetical protein